MSYRVFARKYRPQTFEEVVGQEHITRTLQNAISAGRVAQAYLFVGPRGIGKTSSARILAKALNCVNGPTPNPCGVCDACKEIAEGCSLDVREIDGASNNGVENIRELRENAAYAPAHGNFKIYLIDEVHMLSAGAFNALLKTLEEPPPHVKFIFATTEAQKVPATITSRCQRFDLRRIPTNAISKHLLEIARKEEIVMEPEASDAIARAAEGGLRDAESMLDQAVAFCGTNITAADVMEVFGFTARETITTLMERLLSRDAGGSLAIIGEQNEAGKDLSRLLDDLIGAIRDQLVLGVEGTSAAPRDKLLQLLDHFAETESRMKWASDKKLQFDVAVIKAVHLLGQVSLDDVIATLTALGNGTALPVTAPVHRPPPSPAPPVAIPAVPAAPVAPKPVALAPTPPPTPAAAPTPIAAAPPEIFAAPEETSIDASVAWQRVATTYESSIKYRWLTRGVFFEALADGTVVIQLSPGDLADAKSFIGEAGRKDAETKLGAALGKRITIKLEVGEHLTAHEVEETPPWEEPAKTVAPAAAPAAATPPPAAEKAPESPDDFRNDPLIKKALEIFRGEIQTTAK